MTEYDRPFLGPFFGPLLVHGFQIKSGSKEECRHVTFYLENAVRKMDQNRKVLTQMWIRIVRDTSRFNTGLGSVDQKVGWLQYESGLKMTSFLCV